MKTFIYGLFDPRTQELRYVGKTVNLLQRLDQHLHPKGSDTSHRACWVRSLKKLGLRFSHRVLDEVEGLGSSEESDLIQLLRHEGVDLVNLTEGGEGAPGFKHRDSSREAMSKARKGKPKPPEWAAAIGRAHVGMKRSPEARANMSAAQRGKKMPPRTAESVAKTAAWHRGRKRSPETCAKISVARKAYLARKVQNG